MASLLEEVTNQKHDVWHWRRREFDDDVDPHTGAVVDLQRARRVYDRNHSAATRAQMREARATLEHVRRMKRAAEDKFHRLEREYSHMTPGQKSVDYWRDAVQDRHREVIRCIKLVQKLRREEEADKDAARQEIALAKSLSGPLHMRLDVEDEDDAEAVLGTHDDPETGTVLGDAMVFTNKKQLTEAEKELVQAKGSWHHARAMYRQAQKRRKDELEPKGGNADAIVRAAKQCEQHSNSYHYSQSGGWRVGIFPGGEPWGVRSDCSQFVTKCFFHAKCRDPNGMNYNGGWTGTLGNHGQRVNNPRAGDLCLVGYAPYHHVELVIDSNGNTIGHGDRYVNRSHIRNFSPRTLRRYV